MNMYVILGIVAAVLIALFIFRQPLKTVYLIARVSPYEQPGGGAGSLLVIGDSTGYGTGASKSEDSVAGRLGADYSWYRIQNNSKNGRKATEALEVARNVSDDYNVILLQLGANDLLNGSSVDEVVGTMRELITTLQPRTEHIVIITSGNIGGAPRFDEEKVKKFDAISREYTNAMIELANEYQDVQFVPLYAELTEDVFVKAPEEYMAFDGLHPTSAGYGLWYERAKPYFDEVMNAEK